ncbi:unnamed protein product [Linum trigynum]|uniref:Reverse transcriptase domain-containing protein n=1 Tax=Linum trigynum TaxID=586398 RepID=A0AAV2EPM9_9ROSI
MEGLSLILDKLKEARCISGYYINQANQTGQVTHLLFADDTLLFCETSISEVLHIQAALSCFEVIPDLEINLTISEILPDGDVNNASHLASILGCKLGCLPTVYLGLPLGAHQS